MANETFDWPAANGLPIPYVTAAWSGMDRAELVAGLRAGAILVPPGMAKDWLPPETSGADLQQAMDGSTTIPGQASATAIDRAKVKGWFETLDSKLDST